MENLIVCEIDKCVGCNRCIRQCPVDEANSTRVDKGGKVIVEIDSDKCIACGECVGACHHGSRLFEDDTERFFQDLENGADISLFIAPAAKTNFDDWQNMLTWFRRLGVKKVYDVSLGADICTWAHIRYLQKNGMRPLISQPCPAIVNYILMYKNELIKYLSPVHSPMLCTAVYMKKYERVTGKIAAISPCIAKAHEFRTTQGVDYNITLINLMKYINERGIRFPMETSGFDHYESGLGSLFPMPGGLKENLEYYLGKKIRVDKAEGPSHVYKALDFYAKTPESKLPLIFDVLNCLEGCNIGTGCDHTKNMFDIHTSMDELRQSVISDDRKHYLDELYDRFDKELRLEDFIRIYRAMPIRAIPVNQESIERAFAQLGKHTDEDKVFDCGACGCDTCHEMAALVAKGLSIPENCIKKMHDDITREHEVATRNLSSYKVISKDISEIRDKTDEIVKNVVNVNDALTAYGQLISDIEKIASQINIIAINASIEAARAGQHGRSFAVVAEEIKRLSQTSQKSAEATKAASVKAEKAIDAINISVDEISRNVEESYENITDVVENTKAILNE